MNDEWRQVHRDTIEFMMQEYADKARRARECPELASILTDEMRGMWTAVLYLLGLDTAREMTRRAEDKGDT